MHLLQPLDAACPKNPHNFLLAGTSEPTQINANLIETVCDGELKLFIQKTFQACFSSLTK